MKDQKSNIQKPNKGFLKFFQAEIDQIKKSEFVRNVSTMMTGTAFAQFIPVLISPVLTRIFSPDDFGVLTIFLSYSMIISTIITGKYEMAIMLPKSSVDAANLVGLSGVLTVLLSSVLLLVLLIIPGSSNLLPGAEKIRSWIWILPLTSGLIAYGNILNYWFSRNKNYKSLSVAKFIQTGGSSGFNILVGLIYPFPVIMIVGNLIGQLLNAFYLTFLLVRNQAKYLSQISMASFGQLGRRYIKFPVYDIPNSLSYSLATQGMNIIFSKFFGETVLGFYSMVQRILITPFSFISLSFTQVFFEKMSDVYNNNRNEFNRYLKRAQNRLIIYFFIPFFLLVLLSKYLVPFIFGKQWSMMYQYILVLSPMIFFTLTTSPYTYIFKILNKQEIALILNILRMVLLIGTVIAGRAITNDPFFVFTIFSVASILVTGLSVLICLRFLKTKMTLAFKIELISLLTANILLYYMVKLNMY